jgi:ParB-like nuclease domain
MATSSVKTIELKSIKPTKPNRVLSSTHVRDLAASYGATALASAVVVYPNTDGGEYSWVPIAGFHRIEAAKQSGQILVHAIVVEQASDLQLELIQIDENLLHRALTPAQEARAMARRKFIYQELNPSTRRGGDRRSSKAQVGSKKSFASATASATGRSTTAVNRAVTRGDKIADEVLAMVQGTPIETGGLLDRLAKIPADEQEKVVADELAKASEPPQTVSDVDGDLAKLRRAWAQACPEARKLFVAEVNTSKNKKASTES